MHLFVRKFPLLLFVFFASFCFNSCQDGLFEEVCTEEFRTITLEVLGDSLSDWKTIDVQANDTFKIESSFFQSYYPVLSDAELERVKNTSKSFYFIGYVGDSIVVKEPFLISGDHCHVSKVSGKSQIVL